MCKSTSVQTSVKANIRLPLVVRDVCGRAFGFRRSMQEEAQHAGRALDTIRYGDLDLADEARLPKALRPSGARSLLLLRAADVSDPRRGLVLRETALEADGDVPNQLLQVRDALSSE